MYAGHALDESIDLRPDLTGFSLVFIVSSGLKRGHMVVLLFHSVMLCHAVSFARAA